MKLKLSNPLKADQAANVRAKDVREYVQGDVIEVPAAEAHAIIAAGYAWKVNPDDRRQVAEALNQPAPEPLPVVEGEQSARVVSVEPSATQGQAPAASSSKSSKK